MGLKINEIFVDEVFIKVNATGNPATGLTVTCTIIDESDNRTAGTVAEVTNGWYKVTDFTPDASGVWKLEWAIGASPENYTIYGAFKIFKVSGGQEGDIQGTGFDPTTESLIKLHDDHITEISAARMAELDAANIPADIDTLLLRLTALRAGYLDELDFDLDARLGTPAGASLAADLLTIDNLVDELETRLTAARAGYLDELDFDLNARLGSPAGASLSADLLTIDNLVDDLESRLTAARAGYMDRLQYLSLTRSFSSLKMAVINLTVASSDDNLPDVVLPNISGTIDEVYVVLVVRMIENTSASGANAIAGVALKVRIKKSTGAWGVDDVVAIDLTDNMWTVAASTREGGDVVKGENDVSGEVDAFNATYNLRFEDNQVDYDNLRLNDVQVFLIVTYH